MPTAISQSRPAQYNPARSELHRSIWSISNSLRGSTGVDSQTFQSCVLTLLFYRFLGESVAEHVDNLMREAGNDDFGYASRIDEPLLRSVPFRNIRDGFVESHGFFLLPSQLPQNVFASCPDGGDGDTERLCDVLARTFSEIEASADGTAAAGTLSGLLTSIDLSSPRLGSTPAARDAAMRRMLEGILSMGLDAGDAGGDVLDVFGDAYEFLMSMFASNGGRSGGEYFTPREVSRLLALLATHGKDDVNGVYDLTCGSGSLLLQVVSVLGSDHVGLVAGQEINPTTYALCRMNCILHGLSPDRFDIRLGDTLTTPLHWADGMRSWDAIVSNPPYGISWTGKDDPALASDPRFSPAGVLAPKGNADMAFVMHCVSSLSDEGTAAIVCFPGILYRRGAEQRIRRHLVEEGLVDAVIQLPGRLFFGTGIATSILVLSRGSRSETVAFVDAGGEYERARNNDRLSEANIQTILGWATSRPSEDGDADVPHRVRHVSVDEIRDCDYDLTVSTYVAPEGSGDDIDIDAADGEAARLMAEIARLSKELDELLAGKSYAAARTARMGDDGDEEGCVPLSELVEIPKSRVRAADVGPAGYVGVENLLQDMRGCGEARSDCPDATAIEFKAGDVLIGNIRPYLRKIWLADADGATNGDVLLLRVREDCVDGLLPEFLHMCLSTDSFFRHMQRHARGAKMPRGDKKATLRYRIPLPSVEEQRQAVDAVRTMEEMSSRIDECLEAYKVSLSVRTGWWHEAIVGAGS